MFQYFGEGNIRLPLVSSQSTTSNLGGNGRTTTRQTFAASFRLPRRYMRLIIGNFTSVFVLSFFTVDLNCHVVKNDASFISYPEVQDTPPFNSEDAPFNYSLPPLYERYIAYEDNISVQNFLSQPGNISSEGQYIFFANHARGCGWGNVLQEMVFSVMLAEKAQLGYVWDDYTWDASGNEYSEYNGHAVTSRIPLSTMISGHILGVYESRNQSELRAKPSLLSISSRVFNRLCPQIERVVIDKETVESHLQLSNSEITLSEASGKQVLDAWLTVLDTPKYKHANCIEVNKFSPDHVFDIWLLGSPRMHSLWDTLSASLVLKEWAWSPLIKRSFLKNIKFFAAEKDLQIPLAQYFRGWWGLLAPSPAPSTTLGPTPVPPNASTPTTAPEIKIKSKGQRHFLNDTHPLPILALHLRRGDFQDHCAHLAEWGSTYTGFNSFPASRVRDAFDVPSIRAQANITANDDEDDSDPREVATVDERKSVYARHCLPDVHRVVQRVREVILDYATLAYEREMVELEVQQSKKSEVEMGWRWWIPDGVLSGAHREKEEKQGQTGSNADTRIGPESSTSLQTRGSANAVGEDNRVQVLAAANKHLKKIYILTNGDPAWLEEIKNAPKQGVEGGLGWYDSVKWEWKWEGVATSRDLPLGWEEKPVSQVLDMYVAQRAEVFVGNGFSSLTSNIVMLRRWQDLTPCKLDSGNSAL